MSNIQTLEQVDIKALIEKNTQRMTNVLPQHASIQKLLSSAMIELNKNPDLLRCTPASFISALCNCAQVGLDFGINKAYLVPFNNKKNMGTKTKPNWVCFKECQFQIGYRGYIELAQRTGKVPQIYANPVFEKDYFYIEYGSNAKLEHKPTYGEKGAFIGAYMFAIIMQDGIKIPQFDFMTRQEIDEIKKRSKAQSEYSPWSTDYFEMSKKTVVKRGSKYLPSNTELDLALAFDKDDEFFKGDAVEVQQEKLESKTDQIKRNMATQKAIEQSNQEPLATANVDNSADAAQPAGAEMSEEHKQFLKEME